MDKRIIKTRSAIYNAFALMLNRKSYQEITVEDLLISANISRSTFYSHFKTKEDVLDSVIDQIFNHVFSHSLKEEKSHDFSRDSILDYSHLITHILYHLYDESELVTAIVNNSTKDSFYNNMRRKLTPIASFIAKEQSNTYKNLPSVISTNKIIETFIIVVDYWVKDGYRESPERITTYFFSLN